MNRTVRREEYLNDRLITRIIIHVPEVVAGVPVNDDLTLEAAGQLIYRDCLQYGLRVTYRDAQGIRFLEYTPEEDECLGLLDPRELANIKRTLSGQ